jgi:hypothetical protein
MGGRIVRQMNQKSASKWAKNRPPNGQKIGSRMGKKLAENWLPNRQKIGLKIGQKMAAISYLLYL